MDISQLLERFAAGEFDMVAVGRALIADAAWPIKIRNGKSDTIQSFDAAMLGALL